MNGKNGKQSDYPEIALVPYPVIVAASKGDPDAMKIVLQHFSGLHSEPVHAEALRRARQRLLWR